jgi:hypothetical protein
LQEENYRLLETLVRNTKERADAALLIGKDYQTLIPLGSTIQCKLPKSAYLTNQQSSVCNNSVMSYNEDQYYTQEQPDNQIKAGMDLNLMHLND